MLTLVDVLADRAASNIGNDGFRFVSQIDDAGSAMSFKRLHERAKQIGAELQSRFSPGRAAMLLLPPGLDYVAAFFGVQYGGLVPVPAYPMRRNRSSHRLVAIAEHTNPAVILSTQSHSLKSRQASKGIRTLEETPWLDVEDIKTPAEAWTAPRLVAGDPACIQFTSGSTSSPKGVVLTHENILENSKTIRERCQHSEDGRGVSWLPPYHDMGLIAGIIQPVFTGFPTVLMSPASFLWNPISWLHAMTKYRATTSGAPNFAYELCVRKIQPKDLNSLDLRHWTNAVCGAEPIQAEVFERFAKVFSVVNFSARALNACYGLAEATLYVSGQNGLQGTPIRAFDRKAIEKGRAVLNSTSEGSVRLVSCGEPARGQVVKIVDQNSFHPKPDGEVGEIWIKGGNVANRYFQCQSETEKTFQAYLENGEGPFARTGDLGFKLHGELYVTGRIKEMMIIAGRNIYPQDVEETVAACHALIEPGTVAAYEIGAGATSGLAITAELTRKVDDKIKNEIQRAIKFQVSAEHDLAIQKLTFISKGTLPKTSSGKIMRQRVREETMNKIQNLQSNHMFVCEWEPLVPKVLEVENQGGAYWIFADQSGRCDDLANQLRSRGINCIRLGRLPQNTAEPVVEVYSEKRTLNTDDLTQLETTLRELAIDRPPSAIIFGWGMDSVTSEKSADPNALLETTSALLTLIQSVIRHVSGRLPTINVITLDAESVGENAKRCFPCWQSALPGIGGTAALEHPDIVCRFLDIENTEDKHDRSQNAQLVTDLLLQSETEERIAVRNGLAFGLRMQEIGSGKTPALSFSNTMKLKPGANYILSGGYGEIGIRLVADMVERGARHLTLIGRTPPDKDTMSQIDEIRSKGATIVIEHADVGHLEQLTRVFDNLSSQDRRLAGIIHLAGEFDDTPVIEIDKNILSSTMIGRSIGAWNLHQLSKSHDLDFFIGFSSSVAILCAPGQAAYATSNLFVDALCRWRSSIGLPGLSINWGPWAIDEGVGRDLIQSINPEEGFDLLWHLAAEPVSQLTILPFEVRHMLKFFPNSGERSLFYNILDGEEIVNKKYGRGSKPVVVAKTETERVISSVIKQALALEELSADDGFFELGGDSVVAGGVINRIGAIFGVEIGLEDAIEAMNVIDLAALVDRLVEEQI